MGVGQARGAVDIGGLDVIDEGMPEGVRAFVGAADAEELLVRFTEGDGGPVLDELSVRG